MFFFLYSKHFLLTGVVIYAHGMNVKCNAPWSGEKTLLIRNSDTPPVTGFFLCTSDWEGVLCNYQFFVCCWCKMGSQLPLEINSWYLTYASPYVVLCICIHTVVTVSWQSTCMFVMFSKLHFTGHRSVGSVSQSFHCGIVFFFFLFFFSVLYLLHCVRSCKSTCISLAVCVVMHIRMLHSELKLSVLLCSFDQTTELYWCAVAAYHIAGNDCLLRRRVVKTYPPNHITHRV